MTFNLLNIATEFINKAPNPSDRHLDVLVTVRQRPAVIRPTKRIHSGKVCVSLWTSESKEPQRLGICGVTENSPNGEHGSELGQVAR